MSDCLYINELIQWDCDEGEERIDRVLWIDEENFNAYTIQVNSEKGLPILRRVSEILDALEGNNAAKLENDTYMKFIREEEIPQKNKAIRDRAWNIIKTIVGEENEPSVYKKHERAELIKHVQKEYGITSRAIYIYLRRYWQRGKNINALLPDYENSGGKGKERVAGNKKLGRPRKYGTGINVDEETKKIFRIAIKRYYQTSKKNPLSTAYHLMLKDFYSEDYKIVEGIKYPVLIDQNEIPSLSQFKYFFEKELNIKETISARKGAKKFELENRAILGKSDTYTIGPGSLYQIDATIGDVYLVSRYNRKWIIGRPVIYAVIDVFSRMITGLYVGLEGPSWVGAMMALANTATDKVKFCNEYGISILENEWPCFHIPEAIIGDRGEMESKMVETLVNAFHVKIDNTPPFRGDWKGIIEQYFHTINGYVKPLVPGTIDIDFRQRGGKDYRLDAKLDLYQFTQLIIKCALDHNNYHRLDSYDRNIAMISQDVKSIPLELWNWGIKNRSGRLRTFPEDLIKLNLMPTDRALITEKGIKLKNIFYGCETALKEMWFEKARNKGTWKVDISYDPRNMDYIYLRAGDGRSFEKCTLLESQKRYFNKSYDEIEYLQGYENLNRSIDKGRELQAKVNIITDIEHIVKEAEEMTNRVSNKNDSKTSRLRNIKENRKTEKEANRKNEAFILEEEEKQEGKVVKIEQYIEESEQSSIDSDLELLMKMQKERLNERANK